MNKIEFIRENLSNSKLLKDLASLVESPEDLIPKSEEEFNDLRKFGLYPVEECQPFVTKQGTPFYHLDNMSVIPLGQEGRWMHYEGFGYLIYRDSRGIFALRKRTLAQVLAAIYLIIPNTNSGA